MKPTYALLMSLLLIACSSSPEPAAQTADDQQLHGDEPPTTDAEPGPVMIVEPPESVQTEPLATEVDEPTPEPVRRPEPDSEWCSDCPRLCLDFVAMLEACRDNLPPQAQSTMERTIKNMKLRFTSVDTPEAQKALEPTCQKGLELLRQQSLCR